MAPFWKLSVAGFAATAITYGPARMGFGLFLSEFRADFALSTGMAGLISSLGFLGMLLGLLASYATLARVGPRAPVLLGLGLATAGTGLVAGAPSLPVLILGIVLAMTSAGFAWSPFNSIVNRRLPDDARPSALAVISTGTSLGIAAAGATALATNLTGLPWQAAWVAFAIAGAIAGLGNIAALRAPADPLGASRPRQPWGTLLHRKAMPLYAIAFSFGTTTAIYFSFAADRIEQSGGLPLLPSGTSPAILFLCFGSVGLIGLATGRIKGAIGLSALLRSLLMASALSFGLMALVPTSWAGVVLSAGLQGAYVMMMSGVLAFWSERLFPQMPARSFTAALIAVAGGSVLGPATAGAMADSVGTSAMFLAAAMLSVTTMPVIHPHFVQERPSPA
ncbi:MAG TPA: MFS transporter [Roseovarius sp.]|jgi:predicted MFS family arabinose efflux permease|nr:MFS transporter [Roseovarius sp.]